MSCFSEYNMWTGERQLNVLYRSQQGSSSIDDLVADFSLMETNALDIEKLKGILDLKDSSSIKNELQKYSDFNIIKVLKFLCEINKHDYNEHYVTSLRNGIPPYWLLSAIETTGKDATKIQLEERARHLKKRKLDNSS